jgi:hypothetical protein
MKFNPGDLVRIRCENLLYNGRIAEIVRKAPNLPFMLPDGYEHVQPSEGGWVVHIYGDEVLMVKYRIIPNRAEIQMVKYKITLGHAEIQKVYPDRETEKFVVFGHRREAHLLHEDD